MLSLVGSLFQKRKSMLKIFVFWSMGVAMLMRWASDSSVPTEDDGQGLRVVVDLVGSIGSGDGNGTCGDVIVIGKEVREQGRESDFDDTSGIVGDWGHYFWTEGIDDFVE